MDFVSELKIKYPYLDNSDVEKIVSKAKMFYYSRKYPTIPELQEQDYPIVSFIGQTWVYSACEEIIERLGFNSAVGYRENGMSWSFDNAQLSKTLLDQLQPISGVIPL